MTPHGNPALQLAMTALVPAYGFSWKAGADKLLIVSVGTGQPRPVKPEWVDHPVLLAVWKAIHALTSLAYDTSQLGISMLQWLGASPQPWRINGEVSGWRTPCPPRSPLWTFVATTRRWKHAWLKTHLGEDSAARDIASSARWTTTPWCRSSTGWAKGGDRPDPAGRTSTASLRGYGR